MSFIFGSAAKALEIGDSVPSVQSLNQDGEPLELASYCKEGYALVFFYPKAETPGCIKQVCSLRDAFAALEQKGVKVLGVSADKVESQKRFHENRNLPYPLLADPDHAVINAFGVPIRLTMAKRQAYLFYDGKLVWKDESASTEEQAADVLAVVAQRASGA